MVEEKVANLEDAWQGLERQLEPHPQSDTGGGRGVSVDLDEGRQILLLPLQNGTEVKAPQADASETVIHSLICLLSMYQILGGQP